MITNKSFTPTPPGSAQGQPQSQVVTLPDDQRSTLKQAIVELLDAPQDGDKGVYILAATPGLGKTRSTLEALSEKAAQGKRTQALLVVRETVAETSLGAEEEQCCKDLGVQAGRILGKQHFKGKKDHERYIQQFEWGKDPEVKIVSQALLANMLCAAEGSVLRRCLEQASDIVCDEDPTDSLILPGQGWKLANLAKLSRPCRITQAILAVTDNEDWRSQAHEITTLRKVTTHRLTNRPFWNALHDGLGSLSDQDFEDFKKDLLRVSQMTSKASEIDGTLSPGAIDVIVDAFQHDYEDKSRLSQRFNIKSVEGQTTTFNANVLIPWDAAVGTNVIVLDAYGDLQQYEQVFGGVPIVKIQTPETKTLNVQSAPDMRLDENNIINGKQRQHLLTVLGEVRKYSEMRGKPALLLVTKKIRDSEHFKRALRQVFADTDDVTDDDLAKKVQVQHWQAGRGSNNYYDHDIFALCRPHISEANREETLAALAPTNPDERKRLHAHKVETELLQMLYRNRQPHIENNPPTIVVADEDYPGATPYPYLTPFVPRAHQKLWIELVSELVKECVSRTGGFCADLILGSCLLRGKGRPDPKLAPQINAWLESLPEDNCLRRVLLDGILPADVNPVSHETALGYLEKISDYHHLHVCEVNAAPYGLGGAQKRKVYLPDDSEGDEKAVYIFENFVPPTSRTLSRDLLELI